MTSDPRCRICRHSRFWHSIGRHDGPCRDGFYNACDIFEECDCLAFVADVDPPVSPDTPTPTGQT